MVEVTVTSRAGCRDLNVIVMGGGKRGMFEAPANSKGSEKKIYI